MTSDDAPVQATIAIELRGIRADGRHDSSTPSSNDRASMSLRAWLTLVIALGLVLVAAAAILTVSGVVTPPADDPEEPSVRDDVSAGEYAMGAVFAGQADVAAVRHGARVERDVAAATSDEERATVIAGFLREDERTIASLRSRAEALGGARANEELSPVSYRVQIAQISAEASAIERRSRSIEAVAEPLPSDVRREHEVDVEDVAAVREDASEVRADADAELVSPEVDNDVYGDVATLVRRYNEQVNRTEGRILDGRLAGERTSMYVETDAGAVAVVSFRFDGEDRIADLRAGRHADATIRMETDAGTVAQIATADDAVGALGSAIERDEIRLSGVGWVDGLKWRVFEALV